MVKKGVAILIDELNARDELNGMYGVLAKEDAGKWVVLLQDGSAKKFKVDNIFPLRGDHVNHEVAKLITDLHKGKKAEMDKGNNTVGGPSDTKAPGGIVQIKGLQSRPEFNGLHAILATKIEEEKKTKDGNATVVIKWVVLLETDGSAKKFDDKFLFLVRDATKFQQVHAKVKGLVEKAATAVAAKPDAEEKRQSQKHNRDPDVEPTYDEVKLSIKSMQGDGTVDGAGAGDGSAADGAGGGAATQEKPKAAAKKTVAKAKIVRSRSQVKMEGEHQAVRRSTSTEELSLGCLEQQFEAQYGGKWTTEAEAGEEADAEKRPKLGASGYVKEEDDEDSDSDSDTDTDARGSSNVGSVLNTMFMNPSHNQFSSARARSGSRDRGGRGDTASKHSSVSFSSKRSADGYKYNKYGYAEVDVVDFSMVEIEEDDDEQALPEDVPEGRDGDELFDDMYRREAGSSVVKHELLVIDDGTDKDEDLAEQQQSEAEILDCSEGGADVDVDVEDEAEDLIEIDETEDEVDIVEVEPPFAGSKVDGVHQSEVQLVDGNHQSESTSVRDSVSEQHDVLVQPARNMADDASLTMSRLRSRNSVANMLAQRNNILAASANSANGPNGNVEGGHTMEPPHV